MPSSVVIGWADSNTSVCLSEEQDREQRYAWIPKTQETPAIWGYSKTEVGLGGETGGA